MMSQNAATPLTSRQFLSFETMAGGLFALFVAIVTYVWNGHSDEFKVVKNDVKNIKEIIPTLATKAEMNARFEKVDEKFEKLDKKVDEKFEKVDEKFEKLNEKLDGLILSVNAIQHTLTSKVTINSYRLDQLEAKNAAAEKKQ